MLTISRLCIVLVTSALLGGCHTTTTVSSKPRCHELSPPDNGKVICENSGNLLTCVATCNDGFRFRSRALLEKRFCDTEDGNWFYDRDTFPECIAKDFVSSDICRPVHPPDNGVVRCEQEQSTLVCTGTCNDGYVFATIETTVRKSCNITDGTWLEGNVMPTCIVSTVDNCSLPTPPNNGLVKCRKIGIELVCSAACNQGYTFPVTIDNANRVCSLAEGVWYDGINTFQQCNEMVTVNRCDPTNLSYDSTSVTCHEHGIDLCLDPQLYMIQYYAPRVRVNIDSMLSMAPSYPRMVCDVMCTRGFLFETNDVTVQRICNQLTGTWYTGVAVPKCVSTCEERLLSGNDVISNGSFSASSTWMGLKSVYFGPDRARLTSHPDYDNGLFLSGGWRPASDDLSQFVQVKLNKLSRITGIITKGRGVNRGDTGKDVVTRFRVLYSVDGKLFTPYGDETVADKFLNGNKDTCSEKINWFSCPFEALYVRINPLEWMDHIGIRFDVLGCPSNEESVFTTSFVTRTTPSVITAGPSPISTCSSLLPPKNGIVNCEDGQNTLVCTALCKDGYTFYSGEFLMKRQCDLKTSIWTDGQSFPPCVPKEVPVSTTMSSYQPNTRNCIGSVNDCHHKQNGDYHTCDNCHYFASCSEGYTYVRPCPDNLVFDLSKRNCQYKSTTCSNQ